MPEMCPAFLKAQSRSSLVAELFDVVLVCRAYPRQVIEITRDLRALLSDVFQDSIEQVVVAKGQLLERDHTTRFELVAEPRAPRDIIYSLGCKNLGQILVRKVHVLEPQAKPPRVFFFSVLSPTGR